MQSIILLISLELNDNISFDEWKKMSDGITQGLQGVDGFMYRDSGIGEDGKVYCIVKWESVEKQDAFNKILESDSFKTEMAEFAKLVKMDTMKTEVLKVV